MKNNLDIYANMLRNHLARYNFPEAVDESFIMCRADQAYEVFMDARLNGIDVPTAQDLAITALMQDFDLSFDDQIKEIFSEKFANRIPEYLYDIIIADMDYLLDEYRERFVTTQEFVNSSEGEALKKELKKVIKDYLAENGL